METENDKLVKSLLERTFFTAWKRENINKEKFGNYVTLEVQMNAKCDLACKYCYYERYGSELYPLKISGNSLVMKNFEMLLNWLEENQLFPRIEPFSGEIFSQNIGFKLVDRLLDFYIKNDLTSSPQHYVVIPTNATFIFSDKKTKEVENLLNKAKDNNIPMYLSLSVDGKFVENENRPFKSGKLRDDEYYDKLFAFAKKWNFSFHPMIYSNGVEKWIDNFLWFQEMFKKYDIPFFYIYLLEVRNVEWTKQQIKDFYKFMRFICNYYYNFVGISGNDFIKYVTEVKLSNIFSLFYRVGRGTGCSVQSAMQLRLGDLTHSICHRAAYKPHNLWKFKTDENKIIGIEALNAPLFLSHQTMDEDNFPMCESCFIKYLCNGQCLGSMNETNGSLFAPIPTVCALEHAKMAAVVDECISLDILKDWYPFVRPEVQETIKIYYDRFWKEK